LPALESCVCGPRKWRLLLDRCVCALLQSSLASSLYAAIAMCTSLGPGVVQRREPPAATKSVRAWACPRACKHSACANALKAARLQRACKHHELPMHAMRRELCTEVCASGWRAGCGWPAAHIESGSSGGGSSWGSSSWGSSSPSTSTSSSSRSRSSCRSSQRAAFQRPAHHPWRRGSWCG